MDEGSRTLNGFANARLFQESRILKKIRARLHRLLTPEEIDGAGRCPTYLFRWTLLNTRWGNLYLHKFMGNDWAKDLHDHPKRFVSMGIKGSYLEENKNGFTRYKAPWIRTFPASHKHRITVPEPPVYTIVFVGTPSRDWGFWVDGRWVKWDEYIFGAGPSTDRIDC